MTNMSVAAIGVYLMMAIRCREEEQKKLVITGSHPLEVPDVTVSVGVASFSGHASTAEALVKAADDAMYVSKRSEKEKVVA